jgi:S1-C subfamily serine protease
MSRRTALVSSLASAAVAAAITAMALLFGGAAETDEGQPAQDTIRAELSEPLGISSGPSAPVPAPVTFAELSRSSVDWAGVYARAVPSLVSVVTEEGAGSGFFVTRSGHVITNLHVVAGATQIRVYALSGDYADAEVVARDAGNDLALLKVDPDEVEVVVPVFGASDDLRVGDPVGALGAPFNLPNTLTVGIVSALDRTRSSGNGTWEPLRAMIQTDAALNPGNSGGMLVDERGRVVGIPTQIESPERVSSGIGFAVSVDAMLRSLPTLLKGVDVERSYLGVSLSQESEPLEVIDVVCDSAADQAGILVGDRVLQINGESAGTFAELVEALASVIPGDEMTITVRRGFQRLTLEGVATAWPTSPPTLGCG